MTRTINRQRTCPSCGAPVVSEICAYCGMATGLNTAEATVEYPVLECKEATLNFWTVFFPLIFAAAFGMAGVIMLTVTVMTGFRNVMILMMSIPFSLIGITALVLSLRTVFRYLKVKSRGKAVQATVYGYIDDNVLINDRPAQVVKLLIQTPEGPRFIFYQLGNTLRPYRINDKIDLIVYQNYFMICKTQKTVQW